MIELKKSPQMGDTIDGQKIIGTCSQMGPRYGVYTDTAVYCVLQNGYGNAASWLLVDQTQLKPSSISWLEHCSKCTRKYKGA